MKTNLPKNDRTDIHSRRKCWIKMRLRMEIAFVLSLVMVSPHLGAQDKRAEAELGEEVDLIEAILALTGAADEESLDEEVVERYEALSQHPLKINTASRQVLLSSGLLDAYLVASLMEYKSVHGDILSAAELAQVDGFASMAESLRPFISFYSPRLPGVVGERTGIDGALMTRAGLQGDEWSYSLKTKVIVGERWQAALASRSVYADAEKFPPSSYSFHVALNGNRALLIAGDYSTRFGQGLSLWSGFTMNGLQNPASFSKRPSGLSPSWSFSEASHRGAAGEISFGHFTLTAFAAFPGLRKRMENLAGSGKKKPPVSLSPGANLAWFMRRGQVSASLFARTDTSFQKLDGTRASLDARFCLRGIDLFGEGVWDFRHSVFAALAGTSVPIGERVRLSALCRYYPEAYDSEGSGPARAWSKASDEIGAALGLSGYGIDFTADWAEKDSDGRRQFKALASGVLPLSQDLTAKFRATLRLRNYERNFRSDLRAELCMVRGRFLANCRAEWARCAESGWLGYAEAGYKDEALTAWLRFMAFRADSWDDRIYAYEHDAPGNFTVQACYGRGFSLSLYGAWKHRFRTSVLKAALRASLLSYPWNIKKKPGKAGLKVQLQYEF